MRQKTALITGSASGIGKSIAEKLEEEGVTVIISDVNECLGSEVAKSLGGYFLPCDLSSAEATNDLIDQAVKLCGGVDILVNNAGIQFISPLEFFPNETWENMMQLMLNAPFILTKNVIPYMKEMRWGRIINMGSIHSHVASINKSAYVSAKHGLIGLTKSTALECGEFGITANSVCPAYVRTPLVENQIADQARASNLPVEQVKTELMLRSAAIKRMIEPQEVAELVCYLCSDSAAAVTGAAWNMDMGWTAQ